MKAQFIVTIEGDWIYNGEHVTASIVQSELREAVKDQFEFLADSVKVKRLTKAEAAALARKDAQPVNNSNEKEKA